MFVAWKRPEPNAIVQRTTQSFSFSPSTYVVRVKLLFSLLFWTSCAQWKIKKHVPHTHSNAVSCESMDCVQRSHSDCVCVTLLKVGKPHASCLEDRLFTYTYITNFVIVFFSLLTVAHSLTQFSPISNAYIFVHYLMFALYVFWWNFIWSFFLSLSLPYTLLLRRKWTLFPTEIVNQRGYMKQTFFIIAYFKGDFLFYCFDSPVNNWEF